MRSSKTTILLRCGISGLCLLTAMPAAAQAPVDGAEDTGGEIVVTARRREENLLNVPLSISAVTSDQLEKGGTNGLEDLAKSTPGLAFQSLGGTYQAPVIRGLAQVDQTAQIGNVGIFVDGIYLNNRSGLEFGFLDLERIEVVKGPQSALYGRNTFSGAINYVTKAPKLGEWSGYVTGEMGDYDRRSVQGSLNVPLADIAALRLFGGIGKFDGTIDNDRDSGNLGGFSKRANYGASLLFQPSDRFKLRLFGMRTDVEEEQAALFFVPLASNNCGSASPGGVNGPRNTLYCGKVPVPSSVNLDSNVATGLVGHSYVAYATADYDLDFATLTGTFGYTQAAFSQRNDQTGNPLAGTRPLAVGSALSQQVYLEAVGKGSKEYSYDLKLTSPGDQPFTWMAGVYVYDSKIMDVLGSANATLADPTVLVPLFGTGKSVDIKGQAYYAQASYDLTDALSVSVEGRYTHEKLDFEGSNRVDGVYVTGIVGKTKYNYFTPRGTIDYKFSDAAMAYATVAKGYKIGGFNPNAVGRPEFEYNPETNWTYEIGVKGKLLDNKLVYAADIFYVDWSNIQTQRNITGTTQVVVGNNRGATSKGIELDTTYYFTPGTWLRAGAAFLDPKYKDGTLDGEVDAYCGLLPNTTIATPGCSNDVSGKQLARTTKTQISLAGNVSIPINDMFEGFVRADYSYQSAKHSLSLNQDSQGKIELVNARIGVTSDHYELAFWVRNLFDAKYLARATITAANTAEGSPASGVGQTRAYPGERRTIGVRATYRF